MTTMPTREDLHAYADGELAPGRVAEIERWLEANPDERARVAEWRRVGDELRASLSAAPANARLDPAAIRRDVRARARRRYAMAAAIVVSLGVGALGGWLLHDATGTAARVPMQDAVEAYRIFATDRTRPVEVAASESDELQGWLSQRLGRPLALPDLRTYGYRLLGGRLLATADGPAALLLYEDAGGARISFYVRPSTKVAEGTTGTREDGGLSTRYWFRNGYGFAVVGRKDDPRTVEIQAAAPTST